MISSLKRFRARILLARRAFCQTRTTRGFSARVLDGKKAADEILFEVQQSVAKLKQQTNKVPGLAVILVGNRHDSQRYVAKKDEVAQKVGFNTQTTKFPSTVSEEEVISEIYDLNASPDIHGILVQLPLPAHVDQARVLNSIQISKDVDGFHPYNMGCLALKRLGGFHPWENKANLAPTYDKYMSRHPKGSVWSTAANIPCTAKACVEILDRANIEIKSKVAVILGRSSIVGLPVSLLLMHRGATIINCNKQTHNVQRICRTGDIVISAIGKPHKVTSDWIKPGAVVIDVGINYIPIYRGKAERDNRTSKLTQTRSEKAQQTSVHLFDSAETEIPSQPPNVNTFSETFLDHYSVVGDVDFDEVRKIASFITPVPNGVGPMTVCMLMKNTLQNAEIQLLGDSDHKRLTIPEQIVPAVRLK